MAPLAANLLVLALLALAAYFTWQQVQTFHRLRSSNDLSSEDRAYFRNQAWRRLLGCLLIAGLALLIAGAFLGGLEHRIDQMAAAKAALPKDQPLELDAEQKRFVKFYGFYWIAVLLLLLFLMMVAAWDVWAIRGYGRRHLRRIQDDRRAMIQEQLAEIRRAQDRRREGHAGNGRHDGTGPR